MHVLGGSSALRCGIVVECSFSDHDNSAVLSVVVFGQSLKDSRLTQDARDLQLPLLTAISGRSRNHDWAYLIDLNLIYHERMHSPPTLWARDMLAAMVWWLSVDPAIRNLEPTKSRGLTRFVCGRMIVRLPGCTEIIAAFRVPT